MSDVIAMTRKRLRATWFLWVVVVLFAVSLFAYPIVPDLHKNVQTSTALFWVLVVAAAGLHMSSERMWAGMCMLVAGLIIGLGLSFAWGVSGAGVSLLFAGNPLLEEYRRRANAHNN